MAHPITVKENGIPHQAKHRHVLVLGKTASAVGCAMWLAGCVSVPRDAGFDHVETLVGERIGQRIVWNQGTDADAAAAESVKALLAADLTVEEAVQIALLNNHALQAAYEKLGIAQADLVEAGLLQNPVFGGQFRFPGRPANPWEAHVVQNFLDIFVLPLRKRMAASAFERAKFQVTSKVLMHVADARNAFYTFQGAEQLRELYTTAAQATEASAELASRQFEAGNISELDRANEQALHEQAMIDLSLSEAVELALRERLNGLMGLWGDDADRWRVAGRLPELPESEVTADGLESLALSQRLELSQARQEIEVMAQSLDLVRSTGGIVQLNVGGHYEREPDGVATWGPSVDISLPVFNQGQPALARAEALLRQSQQRHAALAARIRSEVRVACVRMFAARGLAERYRKSTLPLRQRIVEESQLHYNAMQIGPFQLLQARQAQLDAGRQYIETLRSYWVARAELERAVGGRLQLESPSTQSAEVEAIEASDRHQQDHDHGGHP